VFWPKDDKLPDHIASQLDKRVQILEPDYRAPAITLRQPTPASLESSWPALESHNCLTLTAATKRRRTTIRYCSWLALATERAAAFGTSITYDIWICRFLRRHNNDSSLRVGSCLLILIPLSGLRSKYRLQLAQKGLIRRSQWVLVRLEKGGDLNLGISKG